MSKRIMKRIGAACVIIMLTVTGTFLLIEYFERKDCLCMLLTEEAKQYPIDDKLLAVYEGANQESGVFIRATVPCEHGISLNLTIYPDEGLYTGFRGSK